MNRNFFSVIVVLMFLVGCEESGQEHFFSPYHLEKEEVEKLHEGDIILRYGKGLASDLIVSTLDEEYEISHCGLICKVEEKWKVIHSVSSTISNHDGVQVQSLQNFVNDSHRNSVMVLRYKGRSPEEEKGRKLGARAVHYLTEKIPFDHQFDLTDNSSFYCTELIQQVFLDVFATDLMKGKKEGYERLGFSTFWNSPNFETVIDHHQDPCSYCNHNS